MAFSDIGAMMFFFFFSFKFSLLFFYYKQLKYEDKL
jgi:hypothetical protein